MKNIEKIAIDTMISQFVAKYNEMIQASISARAAVEQANQNYKKTAGPLMNFAKDLAGLLIQDDVSEEAIKYMEERMSAAINIPFKAKN